MADGNRLPEPTFTPDQLQDLYAEYSQNYYEGSLALGARIKDAVVHLSASRAEGFSRILSSRSEAIAANQAEITRAQARFDRHCRKVTKYHTKLLRLRAQQTRLQRRRDIDNSISEYLNRVAGQYRNLDVERYRCLGLASSSESAAEQHQL